MSTPIDTPGTSLPPELAERVRARLTWGQEQDVAARIWRKDHTLWPGGPTEVADRLGWLDAPAAGEEALPEIELLVGEVRREGFTHVALLGMGGSSLAPEVLRQSFGTAPGYLELTVLDSTHPDAVAAVAERLPLDRTLFLVSTKSGGTLETRSLYEFFAARVSDPRQFVAITDPGSGLAELAEQRGFRRTFLADPDIGGRYSALSHFGLVPAALIGIDVRELLARGRRAAEATQPGGDSRSQTLGIALGELARAGRDKLTLLIDEPLGSLGLWVEQLVAESTGKQGTGIVPIADEPRGDAEAYGRDRVFLRITAGPGADSFADEAAIALAGAGHPVFTLPFADALDLGALFFHLEFAIAVAGAALEINPFDQPNVQEAKDLTSEVLADFESRGAFPPEHAEVTDGAVQVFGAPGVAYADGALAALLGGAAPPQYVALQAYLPPSPALDAALERVRLAVRDARRTATTVGYGPRFLHSTGQLHKGGPPEGVFLQLTGDGRGGLEIPGQSFDFATLVAAQAVGDREALRSRGLPVLRVHLTGDPAPALAQLGDLMAHAMGRQ